MNDRPHVIHICRIVSVAITAAFITALTVEAAPRSVALSDTMSSIEAYHSGFARGVMRAPGDTGVMIENLELIEDDSPGAGSSEKGTFLEEIFRGIIARKTFNLPDPRAFDARVVLYMVPKNKDRSKQAPYYLAVNGTRILGAPVPVHDEGVWHWAAFPAGLLKKGENTVAVSCDAPRGEGFDLLMARADEYEKGGGFVKSGENMSLFDPGELVLVRDEGTGGSRFLSVGKNSSKSSDGGATWKRMKLGTTNDVLGEYVIRLSLTRHRPSGRLDSPRIDLWDCIPGMGMVIPSCTVREAVFLFEADTPPGTSVTWQVRTSNSPDIMGPDWDSFVTVGKGSRMEVSMSIPVKRFCQWRAVLETDNPLKTPVVRRVTLRRSVSFNEPSRRVYVIRADTVRHRYSSYDFAYERPDEPKLGVLRARLGLDSLLVGTTGDFERINRVRHLVSSLWHHRSPFPEYPEWNALDILDRRDRLGYGGMCVQFSQVFIQSLLSLGYQARFIMEFCHEIAEVYVDELGKWVFVDPESVFDAYEYDTRTGLPLNALEQHRWFLDEYGFSPDHPIDWMTPKPWAYYTGAPPPREPGPPLDFATSTGWINDPAHPDYPPLHRLAGYFRIRLRNNWFSQPYPRPLSQGMEYWPWNGFLTWYDDATPRVCQFALHSDREADFYPTMHRVEYFLTGTAREDELAVRMITFTPNLDRFEVSLNGEGWRESPASFVWKLRRDARNTVDMRVVNRFGRAGKPSSVEVMYHYKEPFSPRPSNW